MTYDTKKCAMIRIHRTTYEKLGEYGRFDESWDDLLVRLLKEARHDGVRAND